MIKFFSFISILGLTSAYLIWGPSSYTSMASIENFALRNDEGRLVALSDESRRFSVYILFDLQHDTLVREVGRLADKVDPKLAQFFLLASSSADSSKDVAKVAKRYPSRAVVLRDGSQVAMRILEMDRVGSAVIVDPVTRNILWRGSVGGKKEGGDSSVEQALKKLSIYKRPGYGSESQLPKLDLLGSPVLSFDQNIARVFSRSCLPCHGPNDPVDLSTQSLIQKQASNIWQSLSDFSMPPNYINSRFATIDPNYSLDDLERRNLMSWIENGASQGDGQLRVLKRDDRERNSGGSIKIAVQRDSSFYDHQYFSQPLERDIEFDSLALDYLADQIHFVEVSEIAKGNLRGSGDEKKLSREIIANANRVFWTPQGISQTIKKEFSHKFSAGNLLSVRVLWKSERKSKVPDELNLGFLEAKKSRVKGFIVTLKNEAVDMADLRDFFQVQKSIDEDRCLVGVRVWSAVPVGVRILSVSKKKEKKILFGTPNIRPRFDYYMKFDSPVFFSAGHKFVLAGEFSPIDFENDMLGTVEFSDFLLVRYLVRSIVDYIPGLSKDECINLYND